MSSIIQGDLPEFQPTRLPAQHAMPDQCRACGSVHSFLVKRGTGIARPNRHVCEVCGKEPWFGKQVSHSHRRSSRRWLPNIQRVRVKHGSNSKRIRVCTSCIKAGKIEKV